jgi:hypothetical protein
MKRTGITGVFGPNWLGKFVPLFRSGQKFAKLQTSYHDAGIITQLLSPPRNSKITQNVNVKMGISGR